MGRNMFAEYQARIKKNTIDQAIRSTQNEYKKVTYSLPVSTLLKLQQASEKTGIKKSNIVNKAIEKFIDELED